MTLFRYLIDADPSVLETYTALERRSGLPTAAIIRRKVCAELFERLTFLVFEQRALHAALSYFPSWREFWLVKWWNPPQHHTLIVPPSIAVVASAVPLGMKSPKAPEAFLNADKKMCFPTEEQKQSYESALREYTRHSNLHEAKEQARLAAELVHLVQWCWELGVEKVCFYSNSDAAGGSLEQSLHLFGDKRGTIVLVNGTNAPQRVVVGESAGDPNILPEQTMTVYVAHGTESPLREPFELVITTSQNSPMVALSSFKCLGAPVITPRSCQFSRTSFNEALEHYGAVLRREKKAI